MNPGEIFEPTLGAYISYCVGFCVRYFAIAGGAYCLLHLAFRRRWLAHRVQQRFPSRDEVGYEIRWSMLNTALTGVSTLLLYALIHSGRTQMYFGIAERGWVHFCLSVALCIVGYDAWFYWQHRLLHTRWLFEHAHAVHHRVSNPTAFAAYAHHPIETFMGNAYFIVFVVLVPTHPMAFAAAGFYLSMVALMAHSGYEFYPQGFTRHRVFGWCGTSTHHNMHHHYVGCNYGIIFNFWDRVMGTNHPAYHDTFDAIGVRVRDASKRTATPAVTGRGAVKDLGLGSVSGVAAQG
jgi:lathosterol oxidase